MNENYIEIKEKRSGFLLKGFLLLASMLISLFFGSLPFITTSAKTLAGLFYLIGGTFFVVTLALFVLHLYKEMKPRNAMILKAHGFIDCINVGENIEIDWTNVSSVKMLGKKDDPFFGINLENTDIVLAKMNEKEADELRDNIEDNFPAILISQSSIRMPINQLKDLFVKFVREARALESDSAKKQKNNPFTSEDVLRAFGHYDDSVKPTEDSESDNNADDYDDNPLTDVSEPDAESIHINDNASTDNNSGYVDEYSDGTSIGVDSNTDTFSGDLFYESLDRIIQGADTQPQSESESEAIEEDDTIEYPDDIDEAVDHIAADDEVPAPAFDTEEHIDARVEDVVEVEADYKEDDPAEESAQYSASDDDTSREIEELLSKAKASRISELEKLLAEDFHFDDTKAQSSGKTDTEGSDDPFATKEFNFSFSTLHDVVPDDDDDELPEIVIPDDVFEQ